MLFFHFAVLFFSYLTIIIAIFTHNNLQNIVRAVTLRHFRGWNPMQMHDIPLRVRLLVSLSLSYSRIQVAFHANQAIQRNSRLFWTSEVQCSSGKYRKIFEIVKLSNSLPWISSIPQTQLKRKKTKIKVLVMWFEIDHASVLQEKYGRPVKFPIWESGLF